MLDRRFRSHHQMTNLHPETSEIDAGRTPAKEGEAFRKLHARGTRRSALRFIRSHIVNPAAHEDPNRPIAGMVVLGPPLFVSKRRKASASARLPQ